MESNLDILNTVQRGAYAKIMADLTGEQRFSILRAGQRSGKTVIEGVVAESFYLVSLFAGVDIHDGTTDAAARDASSTWLNPPEILYNRWPGEDRTIEPKKILVIIDEPFWNPISFEAFNFALEKGYSVFACGSGGPYAKRFAALPGQSFATWELNPAIKRGDLDHEFALDADKAQRDYGAF